jgi:ATP-binding cassette subfamily F protein uup
MVSHDRYLLDRLTTVMVEVDRGDLRSYVGGYGAYLDGVAQRAASAAQEESVRQNLARRELAWLRRGAKARSRKPRARIDAANALLATRPDAPARAGELTITSSMPRLGNQVVELVDVHAGHVGTDPVLRGVDRVIGPGDRLAIVGANGAGKSTFLDLLAGRVAPRSGSMVVGSTVVLGYYDQHGRTLDETTTVREVVAGPYRPPGTPEDRRLMEQFWFAGSLQYTQVSDLSGGERRRLQLLAVLAEQPNVLLLDEPTNDLDLETLRVLEDFLDGWPGTLVVVSHDRAFLERMCDTVLAVEDGLLTEVPGGLDAWIAMISARPTRRPADATGAPAAKPAAARPPTPGLQKELRALEKTMASLQRRYDQLAERVAGEADHRAAADLGRELTELRAAILDAEEQWLERSVS